MFKKITFIFLVFCCLALFNVFTTPPQPVYAAVEGEECSIWWVDPLNDWEFVTITTVDQCPISCFGDVAGDINTGRTWCSGELPPPNLPGIMLGNYCSAESSRTVQLNILGTLGTHFEIEGPTGVFNAITYTFTNLPEGENRFRARAHNGDGSSEWTEWVTVAQDYSAPVTTSQVVGLTGDNNWYTSPVSVSFTANDSQCFGVNQTVYEVNGMSANYSGIPFTIDAEGVNTLTFHSTDGYHLETPQSASIQIDTVPPNLSITPDRPFDITSGWWNAPVTLQITANDATSGILRTEYNLNLAGWTAGNSVTLSADGIYELDAQAIDHAGHLTYDGVVIPIDSTPPTLTVALSGEKGLLDWFITPPTLSIQATDATSGVLGILYQVENGAQSLYTTPLLFSTEGLYTVQAFAVDEAQNITSQTFQVGYDITPPQTTATLTQTDAGMTIMLTGWDGVSGVKTIRMAINGVWVDYHHPIVISETGEYWVQYFSTDFAGHVEKEKITQFTIADTIEIVQVPPVVSLAPPANPPNTPPFETADDFPPDLHEESVYFHSPPANPPNTPPFETADDFPPDLHDESVYFHTPPLDRLNENIKRIPRIVFDEDLPFVQAVTPVMPVNENGIPNIVDTLRDLDAPQIIPPATIIPPVNTTSSPPAPLNGVLVTLATLGMITAGAGVLTMTATAIAKKQEQEAEKAQALADLQAQQALQAQTAIANWDENIQKQADALEAVIVAGKQSQANKNYWAAYAIWKAKVAEARARRRAAEKARLEALRRAQKPPTAPPSQPVLTPFISFVQNMLKIATIGVGLAILLMMVGSVIQDGAEGGVNQENFVGLVGGGEGSNIEFGQTCVLGYGLETSGCDINGLISMGARIVRASLRQLEAQYVSVLVRTGRVGRVIDYGSSIIVGQNADVIDSELDEILEDNSTTDNIMPDFTLPNIDLASGPRITWVGNYNAGVDPLTGECLPCTFMPNASMSVESPLFCDVDVVSNPEHSCPADHFHIFKFNQTDSCYCHVSQNRPDDFLCLANKYSGPTGGIHYPFTSPATLISNPELAICTGGWKQD